MYFCFCIKQEVSIKRLSAKKLSSFPFPLLLLKTGFHKKKNTQTHKITGIPQKSIHKQVEP